MPQESNFIINMIDAKKLVSHQLYKFHIDRVNRLLSRLLTVMATKI
jgi:hypothetical protein